MTATTGSRVLETERTLMRPHRLDDLAASAAMWSEPSVVRYISDGKPSSRGDSWSRLLRYIGHWSALGYGYWAVTDRQTGAFLGEVGFADFMRAIAPLLNGVPEIGWVLHPAAHGRGLATETVAAALRWGDAQPGWKRTFCIVDPNHAASIRVAEKSGYRAVLNTRLQEKPVSVLERFRQDGGG